MILLELDHALPLDSTHTHHGVMDTRDQAGQASRGTYMHMYMSMYYQSEDPRAREGTMVRNNKQTTRPPEKGQFFRVGEKERGGARAARGGRRRRRRGRGAARSAAGTRSRVIKAILEYVILAPSSFSPTKRP
jgi:hypothetical protein